MTAALHQKLAAVVGDDQVQYSPRALSRLGVVLRDGDAPAWWVRPGSAAEVAELIQLAASAKVAVIPVGNAARAPRDDKLRDRPCLFIDSRRMNHVLHVDETSLIVHVQAGLVAHDLERILLRRALTIGDYPPAILGATIGGLLAVRTPGKSSPRHGFFEDAALGLSAVLADGRTIHTRVAPRRATGPDLARALCGSEGTLGFITSAVLRIHRRPEARLLDAHVLPSFAAALNAVSLALREDAAPAAVRVLDGAEARSYLSPDVCGRNEAILVVATAGPTDLATVDRDLVASAANAMGGRGLGSEPAEVWWQRRTGRAPDTSPVPELQVAATLGKVLPAYRAVKAVCTNLGVAVRAYASRFNADGAVLFVTFGDAAADLPLSDERLADVRAQAAKAAEEAGAYRLGHTNPVVNPYFAALRAELDPHNIMNPAALPG
jgi:FAD/FMN-containing dehydrogenase